MKLRAGAAIATFGTILAISLPMGAAQAATQPLPPLGRPPKRRVALTRTPSRVTPAISNAVPPSGGISS
jgi:hypothetical protein